MRALFIIDPIDTLNIHKDSSIAMMAGAIDRQWRVDIALPGEVYADVEKGEMQVQAISRRLTQIDLTAQPWYQLESPTQNKLTTYDVVFMRQDPPFDSQYLALTYLLDLAEQAGVMVVNKTQSVRDCNEKLFILQFPDCITDTLVSADTTVLKTFISKMNDVVVKPLYGMGGESIFRLTAGSPNVNVVLDLMTQKNKQAIMAQRYLPEVKQGDKRILLIDGSPVPLALARVPQADETRANLAAGGNGVPQALTERDQWLAAQVGPVLKQKGLLFVGIDVIGDYITEINVTCPTCVRELEATGEVKIIAPLLDVIEEKRFSS